MEMYSTVQYGDGVRRAVWVLAGAEVQQDTSEAYLPHLALFPTPPIILSHLSFLSSL